MTEKEKRLTIWYEEMDGSDYPLVGKKNANLGEMIKAGIPVAPGFAITIYANDRFISETGIKAELSKKLPELGEVDYETAKEASEFAIRLIEDAIMPPDLQEAILVRVPETHEPVPGLSMPRGGAQQRVRVDARPDGDLSQYLRGEGPHRLREEMLVERVQRRGHHVPDEQGHALSLQHRRGHP